MHRSRDIFQEVRGVITNAKKRSGSDKPPGQAEILRLRDEFLSVLANYVDEKSVDEKKPDKESGFLRTLEDDSRITNCPLEDINGFGEVLIANIQEHLGIETRPTAGDLLQLYKSKRVFLIPYFRMDRDTEVRQFLADNGYDANELTLDFSMSSVPFGRSLRGIQRILGNDDPTLRDVLHAYQSCELEGGLDDRSLGNIGEWLCHSRFISPEEVIYNYICGSFSEPKSLLQKLQIHFKKKRITLGDIMGLYENHGLNGVGFGEEEIRCLGRMLAHYTEDFEYNRK